MHRAAIELRKRGHQVSYPQFPNPEEPDLEQWQLLLVAEFEQLLELDESAGELVFVGHSLGALNFLQAIDLRVLPGKFDRTLLVAPADPALLADLPVGTLAGRLGELSEAVHQAAGDLTIVGSDADYWQPNGVQATFGDPLEVKTLVIDGAKHFSVVDGWGPWQGVIDWLLDSTADITSR